jgi:regulatory protein spx
MIVMYTTPGCASCRKAKKWFKDRNIPYVEKNMFSTILNEKEIRFLLERSENGTDDLISRRSKIIRDQKVDLDDMSVNEVVRFIQNNPSVLKRPIILDEKRMQVGYDDEEIDSFEAMKPEIRQLPDSMCADCPNRDLCGGSDQDDRERG